jgi:hypothetical protein
MFTPHIFPDTFQRFFLLQEDAEACAFVHLEFGENPGKQVRSQAFMGMLNNPELECTSLLVRF